MVTWLGWVKIKHENYIICRFRPKCPFKWHIESLLRLWHVTFLTFIWPLYIQFPLNNLDYERRTLRLHDGAFLRARSPLPSSIPIFIPSFLPSFLPARILYARLLKVAERKDGVVQCLSDDMTLVVGTCVKLTDYLLSFLLQDAQLSYKRSTICSNIWWSLESYKESNEKLCMESGGWRKRPGREKGDSKASS